MELMTLLVLVIAFTCGACGIYWICSRFQMPPPVFWICGVFLLLVLLYALLAFANGIPMFELRTR